MAEHADLDDGKESAGRSRNSTPKTSQPAGGSTVMMQSCVADQLFHDRGLSEEFAGPPLCAHNALITLPFPCSRRIGEPQPASVSCNRRRLGAPAGQAGEGVQARRANIAIERCPHGPSSQSSGGKSSIPRRSTTVRLSGSSCLRRASSARLPALDP
jgi:hypothetical protein